MKCTAAWRVCLYPQCISVIIFRLPCKYICLIVALSRLICAQMFHFVMPRRTASFVNYSEILERKSCFCVFQIQGDLLASEKIQGLPDDQALAQSGAYADLAARNKALQAANNELRTVSALRCISVRSFTFKTTIVILPFSIFLVLRSPTRGAASTRAW